MRALSQRLTGSQVPGGRAIEAPPTVAAERAWNRNVQSQLLIHQVRGVSVKRSKYPALAREHDP